MAKQQQEAQNPLILRCNRLIEAFAKSDDERDFYLDRKEGFIFYVDLDKSEEELLSLEKELEKHKERYCMIPKLTFYETKKIMEGFINEKVYDIDTKEKLLDIIQSKEARENFLEFIYDHHAELEKWHAYYQERSRIRIIEWLRTNHFSFVFEEDLELPKAVLDKLKKELFHARASKDVLSARKALQSKAKTYYSNEALNPRPKRGRPPKQAQKVEMEPQLSTDIYNTVPNGLGDFLFAPDLSSTAASTFSSKFGNETDLFTRRAAAANEDFNAKNLSEKLAALRSLSTKWKEAEEAKRMPAFDEEDEEEEEQKPKRPIKRLRPVKKRAGHKAPVASNRSVKPASNSKKRATLPSKKAAKQPLQKTKGKQPPKTPTKNLRPMMKLKKKKS
jgi:hypothetical protein